MNQPLQSRTAVPGATGPARRIEFGAPLFGQIVARMHEGERWVVLDLGQIQPATVTAFGRFRCRLDIADLPADLDTIGALDDALALKQHFGAMLPGVPAADAADVILCWDLLNYFDRPALTALMRRIAARARSGAVLHALIAYSQPHMPARPGLYHPLDDDHLVCIPTTTEQRKAPRYTPKDLERYMQGFRADQRRLLNNGMQEYLFRL